MPDQVVSMELTKDGERIPLKVNISTLSAAAQAYLEQKLQDAAAFADEAQQWANAPYNVEVEPGLFSAFHYAQQIEKMAHAANEIFLAKDGSDTNTGMTPGTAFKTFEAALARLREMTKFGQLCALKVFPGSYVEKGNLEIPANAAVVSQAGQFVTELVAAPGYEQTNMFLVNSGSYLQGFSFRNQQIDSFDNPTVGFAVAFAPGANIKRSPYIRDSSQLSNYHPRNIAAPLDPENANPAVGMGGGMLLADRAVLNPNSIFPYMLAFGATPRTPNGMGYVSKNGAGINGISSLTIFSRVSFYALNGGQITLNNSGTQFGDISMYAKGSMDVVEPVRPEETALVASPASADLIRAERLDLINDVWEYLASDSAASTWMGAGKRKVIARRSLGPLNPHPSVLTAIDDNVPAMVNNLWNHLVTNYNADTPTDLVDWSVPGTEAFTRRDAAWLISAILRDLRIGADNTTRGFVEGLYDENGIPVFAESFRVSLAYSWTFLKSEIRAVTPGYSAHWPMLDGLFDILTDTLDNDTILADTRVVIPYDLETYQAVSPIAEGLLLDNASLTNWPVTRTDALINDMWAYLLDNEPENVWSGVDWLANPDYQTFTKRDAQWLLTALARDFRHGNTQSTRRFVEGLFNRNGEFVFDPRMKEGLKMCWDYLVYEFRLDMTETDHQAMTDLVDLAKRTLDNPVFGFSNMEALTRRDASNFIESVANDLASGSSDSTVGFALGLFDYKADYVFDPTLLPYFTDAWERMRGMFKTYIPFTDTRDAVVGSIDALINAVSSTVTTPVKLTFNSLIESLGHQFNNAGAGVNKNALPLNFRRGGQNRTVPFTVIEAEGGRVRWSGSDELNNQYLAGGTRINGLTGRIEGRPFDTAVRQIARRIANTRGNF